MMDEKNYDSQIDHPKSVVIGEHNTIYIYHESQATSSLFKERTGLNRTISATPMPFGEVLREVRRSEYIPPDAEQVEGLLRIKDPEQIYGREGELERGEQALLEERLPILVHGFPGIGKSTFLSKLVNTPRVKTHFSENILGFRLEEKYTLEDIVARFARLLGFVNVLESEDQDTRLGLLGQALRSTRPNHLIVLDNADENQHMDAMIQFRDKVSHRIIVGSRTDFKLPFQSDSHLEILGLRPDPALRLFSDHAKLARNQLLTEGQIQRTTSICRLLDNHPQAIVLAAGSLTDPSMSLEDLQEYLGYDIELFKTAGGISRETSILVSFSVSYNQLTSDEKVTFDACGAFALGGAAVTAIAAATGLEPPVRCKVSLRALHNRSLIEHDSETQRTRMHPLMRAYARRQLIEREKGAESKSTITGRVVSYYLRYAEDNKFNPNMLDAEHDNLLQAAQWAHDKSAWIPMHEIWKSLDDWLESIGDRKSQARLTEWAIKANEMLERPIELSEVLCSWSIWLSFMGRSDAAKQSAE